MDKYEMSGIKTVYAKLKKIATETNEPSYGMNILAYN